MRRVQVIASLMGAIVSIVAPALSTSAQYARPNSQDASLLPIRIDAQNADRRNAQLYSRSAPSLDHYYDLKADEIEVIIHRIKRGEEVPSDDIQHALDNSAASTFGVPFTDSDTAARASHHSGAAVRP